MFHPSRISVLRKRVLKSQFMVSELVWSPRSLDKERRRFKNRKLHLLWKMLIYWRCRVCMIRSSSSMHAYTKTVSCLFSGFFRWRWRWRCVGGHLNLQGPWTHLSRLIMKEPTLWAQQVVSCSVFRGSAQLGKSLEFQLVFVLNNFAIGNSNKYPQCTSLHL